MEKLKIGLIGAGHLGKLHLKLLKEIPSIELVGFFDADAETRKETSELFSLKNFNSTEELLAKTDAVSIAVTTSAHYKIASEALANGQNIFIEKPITATQDEAKKLVDFADKNGLIIQVGHIERFNPAILAIEKYIDNPMFIQTDRLAQFNPRGTDVAVVLDLMIHDIDLILSFIKSKVKSVSASGVAVVSDTLDIANARIQFENGAVANVTASRISQKKMRKMRLFQKDAYLSIDFITGTPEVYRLLPGINQMMGPHISFGEIGVGDKKRQIIYEQPDVPSVNALKHELQLFADAVLNKKEPVVSGKAGHRALRIAELIEQKIKEGNIQ